MTRSISVLLLPDNIHLKKLYGMGKTKRKEEEEKKHFTQCELNPNLLIVLLRCGSISVESDLP